MRHMTLGAYFLSNSYVNRQEIYLQCIHAQSMIGTNDGTGQLLILSYNYDIKLTGHSLAS